MGVLAISDSVSAEVLLDQIHEKDNFVAFCTIYCKLHDIAIGLLDSHHSREVAAKEVLRTDAVYPRAGRRFKAITAFLFKNIVDKLEVKICNTNQ